MNVAVVAIHPIRLGVDCCYLLVGDGGRAVLVDAGMARQERHLRRELRRCGVEPSHVELVLVTHCHWDHVGSARAIRELTGAKVAVHAAERERLEAGSMVMPAGVTRWGRIFRYPVKGLSYLYPVAACPVDVVVDDGGLDLAPFGVAGRVLHTPGHSPGSLSVLLPSGEAFVGDLAMNGLPLRLSPGLPIFAEELPRLRGSLERLLSLGPHTIYPAHGAPFPAEVLREVLYRLPF